MQNWQRYKQQIIIDDVGLIGQQRLADARVLVVGCGGLAHPLLSYLTAAGIGEIGIIDDDKVELSNLQRQFIFRESDLGQLKTTAAKNHLQQLNSAISLITYQQRLTIDNIEAILKNYDIIADCSDNFASRYLINDYCVRLQKTLVSASAEKFNAQIAYFPDGDNACYQCLYPEKPQNNSTLNCNQSGIIGPVLGVAGSLQANFIINHLLGLSDKVFAHNFRESHPRESGDPKIFAETVDSRLRGNDETLLLDNSERIHDKCSQLLHYDGKSMKFATLDLRADPHCSICRHRGKAIKQKPSPLVAAISASECLQLLNNSPSTCILLDVRNDYQRQYGSLPQAVHIPYLELAARYQELLDYKQIIVVCQYESTSRQAGQFLAEAGGLQCPIAYVEGGIIALQAAFS